MKKKFLLLFIFFVLISCKNNSDILYSLNEDYSIKNTVIDMQNNISWSRELEESRLTTPLNKECNKISSSIDFNTEVMKVIPNFQQLIYPEFENFGKLDISSLNTPIKHKIYEFCDLFSKGKLYSISNYFINKYKFNYIFFVEELTKTWKNCFNTDFPIEKEQQQIFSKWLIGEPFHGEEIIQIPIRFYCNTKTLDVTLYISISNQYSFYQITIDKWGNLNGKK